MTDFSDEERKVLSYLSRGASKDAATSKIAAFFGMKTMDAQVVIDRLRKQGYVIESKGVSGVVVYTTSPLKVKRAMLDERIVQQLTDLERGTSASGFKKKTFDANTGAVVEEKKRKESDLGFDIV